MYMYMYKFVRETPVKEKYMYFLVHTYLHSLLFLLGVRRMGHITIIIDDEFSSNKICSIFQSFKLKKKS